jgi:hypothetical protein
LYLHEQVTLIAVSKQSRNSALKTGSGFRNRTPSVPRASIIRLAPAVRLCALSPVAAGYLERLLAGEIQWAMHKLFRQYDGIAHLLLPTELLPKDKRAPAKEKAKAEPPQPQLNFGE